MDKKVFQANNTLLNRMSIAYAAGKLFAGKRDLYDVLGYQPNPDINNYYAKYLRQDIAHRIISAYPDAVWTRQPSVQEDENRQNQTDFEKAFTDFAKQKRLFNYLNRLDKLACIGQYSVLLIGLRDGVDLRQPAGQVNGIDDILYLIPYSESNAEIQEYEEDVQNERYGLPKFYTLRSGGYTNGKGNAAPSKSLHVHHSRVLHVSEDLLENEVFGTPRLQSVINRLDDLEKVVGGSAEIFWINGRGGLNLNADKDTVFENPEKLEEHAENYIHQLTRILKTKGIDVRTLELGIHDPDKHVSVILDLIAGATGIPKRILVGSERGELASTQDEGNWMSRVEERRDTFCEPMMLRPFIDRMMEHGALPTVKEYEIIWPKLVAASEDSKATVALKKSQAINTYVNGLGADMIIPPKQFVEDILGEEYREDDLTSLAEIDYNEPNPNEPNEEE